MASTGNGSAATPSGGGADVGACGVRRWYIHMAASAIVFAGGLLLLLAWRAFSLARRRLRRHLLLRMLTERRVSAAAVAASPAESLTEAPTASLADDRQRPVVKATSCSGTVRDFAGRIVSPHATTGRVTLVLNFSLSMASVGFYAYEAVTWTGHVENCLPLIQSPLRIIDLVFNVFFLVRFCLRFLAAQSKLWFWLELHSIVDFCTVPPAFVSVYLEQYWLGLRSLRALHVMSLPDVLQQVSLVRSGSAIRLLQLVTIFACVWFLGATATHVLENAGDAAEATFGECLYFIIVTMSTVGFGDVTPKTDLSRTFVSLYILVALSIFASFVPELAGMVASRSRYSGSFTPQHGRKHIVVCGDITRQSVDTFLENLLHKDRNMSNSLEVVCMGPQKPDLEFQGLLKKYFRNVTYLEGTILSKTDCRRASLQAAEAAIVLASQYAANPDEEDDDNILRAVSIKNVAPRVRCIVQLLRHHNKRRLDCVPHWDWTLGDECVCSSELKLGLLAQSCAAPGFSTLMANLFATRSMPTSGEAWEIDYYKGGANEIYSELFGPAFHGISFAEAAAVCFAELGITLLAAMTEADGAEPSLLLNPADRVEGFQIPATQRCRGFFLADSQQQVQQILTIDVERARVACRLAFGGAREGHAKAGLAPMPAEPPGALDPGGVSHWCEARDLDTEALLLPSSARRRANFSGHYILCVIGGSSLHDVGLCSFVGPLRSRAYARRNLTPILIVAELSLLRREWAELCHFPEVFAVPGSPMSRASLRAAGIDRCDMCVVISGNSCGSAVDQADPYLVDREVVMCTLNIRAMDLPGGSDLYHRVLGLQPPRQQPTLGTPVLTEIFVDKNIQYLEQEDQNCTFEEIHSTQAFVCGGAFAASVLDSLLATVYYNANAMLLIRALVTGGAAHQAEDPLEGPTALARGVTATSRVTQLAMTDDRLEPYGYSTFGHLFLGLLGGHGILCFGVYRYKDSYDGGGGCVCSGSNSVNNRRIVIACPGADFRMLRSDAVFCLLPASSSVPVTGK